MFQAKLVKFHRKLGYAGYNWYSIRAQKTPDRSRDKGILNEFIDLTVQLFLSLNTDSCQQIHVGPWQKLLEAQ